MIMGRGEYPQHNRAPQLQLDVDIPDWKMSAIRGLGLVVEFGRLGEEITYSKISSYLSSSGENILMRSVSNLEPFMMCAEYENGVCSIPKHFHTSQILPSSRNLQEHFITLLRL